MKKNIEKDYNGKYIECPYCGKKIKIEYDTARCNNCGWSAIDSELDEIMEI